MLELSETDPVILPLASRQMIWFPETDEVPMILPRESM